MSKKTTGTGAGDAEALRIYERMEEERQRKEQARSQKQASKKVTLARVSFLDKK